MQVICLLCLGLLVALPGGTDVWLCMATAVNWEETTLLCTAEHPSGQAQTSLAAPNAALQSVLLVSLVHSTGMGLRLP